MDAGPQADSDERFVAYLSQYEGSLRAFVASQLSSWEGVDEVVQSASIVMWRKFDQFDSDGPDTDFLRWAFVIARFEILKFRSRMSGDRLVLSDQAYELLAVESEKMAAEQSEREQALQFCLDKLAPAQRELIDLAYSRGFTIKDVASQVGRSPTALYKALARIRDALHRCIQKTIEEQGVEGNA